MKCKFCGFSLGLIKSGELADLCSGCMIAIGRAAIADGYTVADGVVMKPCNSDFECGSGSYRHSTFSPPAHPVWHCEHCDCHGTGRVVAGGGGT